MGDAGGFHVLEELLYHWKGIRLGVRLASAHAMRNVMFTRMYHMERCYAIPSDFKVPRSVKICSVQTEPNVHFRC